MAETRVAMTTRAGTTDRGWGPSRPRLAVTTNRPRRPVRTKRVDTTCTQKLAMRSAKPSKA